MAAMPTLYDAVLGAGATPFGMFALNSLRIEKGYRAWKGDLSSDYSLLEGGLDRFIDWSKPDFTGKPALEIERQAGPKKRCVTLRVDAAAYDPPYMATLWHDGGIVGEVTSAAWGYRVGGCVALGMLKSELATAGREIELDIYGSRHRAVVQPDAPLWDPKNERLRV
jgi:Glycine cleavage system T protein (aminomethyltransferase)